MNSKMFEIGENFHVHLIGNFIIISNINLTLHNIILIIDMIHMYHTVVWFE